MIDFARYPRFSDPPHKRPILSVRGGWVWLIIPILTLVLPLLVR